MSCTAIVGINWGDEGKGRMVDLLTESFDVVVRFQGGTNAGHKVINENGWSLMMETSQPLAASMPAVCQDLFLTSGLEARIMVGPIARG